jgi:UDP:flavonoid glycosyltransferase YjiC (YdhE family)
VRVFQTLLAFSGNAQPQLAVTRRLVERGHEVRVLAHRAAGERVRATGAELVAFEQVKPDLDLSRRETDSLRDWESRTRFGASLRLVRNGLFAFVVAVNRECAARLAEWRPEVVAYDWMLTGAGVAAEGAGLPAAALVHCPYPYPHPGAPPPYLGLRPLGGPLGRVRDGLLAAGQRRTLDRGVSLLNKARAEQRLAPLAHWQEQLLRAQEIHMLTAPELDLGGVGLPAQARYVGPAFEPYEREWDSPWPAANEDPLVVVSLSTSYMNQAPLAQRILDALAPLPVRALLTSGPALAGESLRLPANARAVAYVAHRSVFPHAALVISHAGWQTINAALADGVPLVCIPDGRDQPDNAARVLACGAGVRESKRASPERLRAAIERALADGRLRERARAMAGALARSDGASASAEALERLAAGAREGALRA